MSAVAVVAVTWVTPVAGAVLGASILAPLIALWFLKLRRRKRVVSSTLLWTRSLADLRANTPFQRIRFSWLLLLQILAVLAIAFALAQPEAEGLGSSGGRHVLIIDRSASMNTLETTDDNGKPLDPPQTRLDLAKDAAKRRVRELLGGGWFSTRASDVMIVSFGLRAEIKAPFTDSIAALEAAIDGIAPTDETTKLAEALELARAFTTSTSTTRAARRTQQSRGHFPRSSSTPMVALPISARSRCARARASSITAWAWLRTTPRSPESAPIARPTRPTGSRCSPRS
jgi:hypothetical protein